MFITHNSHRLGLRVQDDLLALLMLVITRLHSHIICLMFTFLVDFVKDCRNFVQQDLSLTGCSIVLLLPVILVKCRLCIHILNLLDSELLERRCMCLRRVLFLIFLSSFVLLILGALLDHWRC